MPDVLQAMREWEPGDHGKGLLIGPNVSLRLIIWAPLAFGGPHHLDVALALGASSDCRAFLFIAPGGEVSAGVGGDLSAQEAVQAAVRLDDRLVANPSTWRFE